MLNRIDILKIKKPLLRFDSGNDSEDNIRLIQEKGYDFLIKRNPRRSKDAWVQEATEGTSDQDANIRKDPKGRKIRIYQKKTKEQFNGQTVYYYTEVKEILEEKDGQMLLIPKYELESYVSTLDETVEDIKEVYHQHGICEQFHSKLKTDMGVERLPSGKMKTNDFILHLSMFAYNILRIIGQTSLMIHKTKRDKQQMVTRRRLSTVIKTMIITAAKYVRHARLEDIKLGYGNRYKEVLYKIEMCIKEMNCPA